MHQFARIALSVLLLSAGCAEGSTLEESGSSAGTAGTKGASSASSGDGSGGAGGESAAASTGAGGNGLAAQSCPEGEFATGLEAGQLVCAGIEDLVIDAVNSACSVYFGWADECGACTTPPTKWGRVGASSCLNGLGNGTCTKPMLGAKTVQLYGLNTAGTVNDDDKFHLGFVCNEGSSKSAPGPCPPGSLVSAVNGHDIACTPASGAILDFVRSSCSLYFGWRDSCDGCTTAPDKWGKIGTLTCANGVGVGNTCTTPMLENKPVQVFGLSTGGTVDENDKFYVGLRCEPPKPATGSAPSECPPGQLVTGIEQGGAVVCTSPAPLVASYFADRCALYLGWHDNCASCVDPPTKWGAVTQNVCTNDIGAGSTCQTATLSGVDVKLFGLNTDGKVNDDDRFYFGFSCE